MPVPSPSQGESKDAFISRCIRTLKESDPNRSNEQVAAICYSQWGEEGLHPDFSRILGTFLNWFKDGSGYDRFQKFVSNLKLDISKAYRPSIQFAEGFQWLKPEIQCLKQDKEAKYYKISAITANTSMNENDYRDWQKLRESAPTLQFSPVNYNHDHKRYLPFPRTRVDIVGPEDFTVECLLRVDNEDKYLQQQLDHDPVVPEGKWIHHPSVEGFRLPDGHRIFMGLALLEADGPFKGMPGDPLSEIHSLAFEEGLRDDFVNVGEPSKVEVKKETLTMIEAQDDKAKPYPNVDEFADPENRKYPIDCEHVQAAWSYINMPKNQEGYSPEKISAMKGRIKVAMKRCGHEVVEESIDNEKVLRLSEANLKLQGDLASTRALYVEAQHTNANLQTELAKKETKIIELEGLKPLLETRDQNLLAKEEQLKGRDVSIEGLKKQITDERKAGADRVAELNRKWETREKELLDHAQTLEKSLQLKTDEARQFQEGLANQEILASNLRKDVDALTGKATDANEYARKAIRERSEMQAELAGLRDETARLTNKNAELTQKLADRAKQDYGVSLEKEKFTEAIAERDAKISKLERQTHDIVRALKKQNKYVLDEEGKVIDA